nr:MAG TPA: hypothetical protein [Caudoviricetes sp.]
MAYGEKSRKLQAQSLPLPLDKSINYPTKER